MEEILAQASLGASQPAVSQVVTILWMIIAYSSGSSSPRSHRDWGSARMNPRICKRPAPGSSLRLLQLRWRTGFYPTHLGAASTHPGRGCNLVAGFASSRGISVLVLLLGQLTEVACAIQSHIILVGIEAWKSIV